MIHIFSNKYITPRQSIALVILVMSAIALAVLVTVSGPRIRTTDLDQTARNQTFTMSFNSELKKDIENFSIDPIIDYDVEVSENRVVVSFNGPLLYGQDYRLSYTATDSRNRTATVASSFESSNKTAFYLTRNEDINDTIQSFSTKNFSDLNTEYEAENIVLYALSASAFAVLQNDNDAQRLFYINGSTKKELSIPENNSINELQGSSTKNSFIMRLIDSESYRSSLWEYSSETDNLVELTQDNGESIQASNIDYAPDGESVVYQDENRVLQLRNFTTSQPAITFGEFDILRRFLPNEKAIFGYRSNKPIAIRASDGSFLEPPDSVELSYQALLLQDLSSYLYFAQRLNEETSQLEQLVLSLEENEEENILYRIPTEDSLLLSLTISPNDQFIFVEQSPRPTIYDNRQPNAKPQNITTTVYDRETGANLHTLSGFDIQWR